MHLNFTRRPSITAALTRVLHLVSVGCLSILLVNFPAYGRERSRREAFDAADRLIRDAPISIGADEVYPFAGLQYIEGGGLCCGAWKVIGFYFSDQPTTHGFIAQLIDGVGFHRNKERWTSSNSCPALMSVLKTMTELKAPQFELPKPRSNSLEDIYLDPGLYKVWGSGDKHAVDLELSGSPTSSIQIWVSATVDTLRHCWRKTMPFQPTE